MVIVMYVTIYWIGLSIFFWVDFGLIAYATKPSHEPVMWSWDTGHDSDLQTSFMHLVLIKPSNFFLFNFLLTDQFDIKYPNTICHLIYPLWALQEQYISQLIIFFNLISDPGFRCKVFSWQLSRTSIFGKKLPFFLELIDLSFYI